MPIDYSKFDDIEDEEEAEGRWESVLLKANPKRADPGRIDRSDRQKRLGLPHNL